MEQESNQISGETMAGDLVADSADASTPSNAAPDIRALNERIGQASQFIDLLRMELNKVIVGQSSMVDRLLIGLLGNGHVLLEGGSWIGQNTGHQKSIRIH